VNLESVLHHGVVFAYAAVFAGGLLTALTPCVYPLIPITVSIFGAKKAARKAHAALLSATYVLGIAITFTSLGVGAAAAGVGFGAVLANPWVVGTIAIVFTGFAASMFGAFEMALPVSLQGRLAQVGGSGYGGALAMGLVSGIIAAPCTGPVLGAVLTYIATTQKLLFGGSLMFAYAMGMGLPFFLIGTFALALPKSGPWMDGVKSFFGIVMLVAALFFLKQVIPLLRVPVPGTAGVRGLLLFLLLGGLALGAVHGSFHASLAARLGKGLGILLVIVAVHAGLLSLESPRTIPSFTAAQWRATGPAFLARARAAHRPVLLDLGADWCAACKELERQTYPDPAVAAELAQFDFALIDDKEATLVEELGGPGLPFVVFYDAEGRRLEGCNVTGFVPPAPFLAHLRQVRACSVGSVNAGRERKGADDVALDRRQGGEPRREQIRPDERPGEIQEEVSMAKLCRCEAPVEVR
jgi:thiol:disulfide interchange protein DsbD